MTDISTMWSSLQVELDAHRPRRDSGSAGHAGPDDAPSRSAGRDSDEEVVPVTILTGFLGAGKSTLLARLLIDPIDDLVVKAVVNDVGSLPFDPTLVSAASQVEIELTNGCGCCERTAELGASLDRLGRDPATDLIVLEASGVADPLALAQVVEGRPGLAVDRIVAVADGGALATQLASPGIAEVVRRQLDAAHALIITNGDRLEADELEGVLQLAAEATPGRVIAVSTLDRPAVAPLTPNGPRGSGPLPGPSEAGHELPSITMAQEARLDRSRLERILDERPAAVVRGKGRLELGDGTHVDVQLTSTSVSITEAEPGPCGFTAIATSMAQASAFARSVSGAHSGP